MRVGQSEGRSQVHGVGTGSQNSTNSLQKQENYMVARGPWPHLAVVIKVNKQFHKDLRSAESFDPHNFKSITESKYSLSKITF